MVDMLANAMMVIISQYVSESNQHVVHLELTQCYISIKIKIIGLPWWRSG